MRRRPSLAARGCAFAILLSPAVVAGLLAGCGDDTLLAAPIEDSGAAMDSTTVEASVDSAVDGGATVEASCAVDAGTQDPAQVAAGLQLVGTHKCENCHGDTLSGNNDGVPSSTAQGGTAYPPNLTPDPATGLGCWTNAQIENAFLNGIDDKGMALCSPMPVFGHIAGDAGLTSSQAQSVVAYLRSLSIVSNQVPDTPDCPVPPPREAGVDAESDASPDGSVEASSEASVEASSEASVDASRDASVADGGLEAGDCGAPADGDTDSGD